MDWAISCVPPGDHAVVAGQIEQGLLASLAGTNPQGVNTSVVLAASAPGGSLAGGTAGVTSYDWLLVKTLWVHDQWRGQGLGTALMTAVEAEGRRLGCHAAWLDTSNAAARAFYVARGYAEFGVLANAPGDITPDHKRWFLHKRLA